MRFNFKKISAIASSVLLTGMTIGVAAAANYPSPFVSGSSSDVAIVYGTGTGVSSLDQVEATNIQSDLGLTGMTVVSGGESFTLEKSSDNFNFNDNLASVYDDLGDDEMDALADGTYDDGDIDEDYSQTINLNTAGVLTLFADNDYEDKEPTLGIHYDEGDEILSYVVEYDSTISMEDMEDTEVPLFGTTYYVLDVENGTTGSKLTLLDSAQKAIITQGETVTYGGKQVSIDYIDSDEVKFSVDGESTDKLSEHEYEELSDGSYIVVNENLYDVKESGVSKVEFSIGAGKMVLEDTEEIEVNDEKVDELYADFEVTDDDLSSITITWKAEDDLFLTEDNSLTMPLFETISLVFNGFDFPSDPEEISFANGDTLVLEMGNFNIDLLTSETADAVYMGDDGYPLVTKTETLAANFTGTGMDNVTTLTGGLSLMEDDRFIVTILDTDLGDIEQAYYEVSKIDYTSDSDIDLDLTDLIGNDDMSISDIDGDGEDIPGQDNLNLNITAMNDTNVYLNFTGGTVTFNKVVSEKGLLITLPAADRDDAVTLTSTLLTVEEQDEDGDVGSGSVDVSVGVSNSSNDKLYATCSDSEVTLEEESDDNYIGYFESTLATKVVTDESGDEYDLDLEYYGEEVTADVQVAVGGELSTSSVGGIVVKDSEVSSVSSKNLIVVGGSCINSVAANLLDGALCGPAFTSATGVGSGQFVIESMESPYDSSKVALLVAGYEAADTQAASAYLRTQDVDTSAGKKYVGTSSTSAELVVE